MEDRLTLDQAAHKLGLKPQTVRLWIKQGKIPASKPLGRWLIDVDVINNLLKVGLTEQPEAIQIEKKIEPPQAIDSGVVVKIPFDLKNTKDEINKLKLELEQKDFLINKLKSKIDRLQELLEVRDEELRQARENTTTRESANGSRVD